MTNATILPPQQTSLIDRMAANYNLSPEMFLRTIKQTVMPAKPPATIEQIATFLMVADKYNLNPFTKEIYAFPTEAGGIQAVVGVDGWATIINRQPTLNGIQFTDNLTSGSALLSITCRISRTDRLHPVEVTEYMAECVRGTSTWKKWPARMLRHKALIQCARYAFGLSGIMDTDEAERMLDQVPDVTEHAELTALRTQELAAKYAPSRTQTAIPAVKERIPTLVELLTKNRADDWEATPPPADEVPIEAYEESAPNPTRPSPGAAHRSTQPLPPSASAPSPTPFRPANCNVTWREQFPQGAAAQGVGRRR